MTALVSTYTEEGFIAGADSLRLDLRGQVVTESATKLFATEHRDFMGAYGWAGTTGLEYIDGRPALNVLDCACRITTELRQCQFSSAQEFVEDFCQRLTDFIARASLGIALPDPKSGTEFLRGMFVGYHRNRPFLLQTAFSVSNGYLQSPQLTQLVEAPNDFCIASGSAVVWDELRQEGVSQPSALAEGTTLVKDYVARCIKNDTDPHC
jgi:hypothetical protein